MTIPEMIPTLAGQRGHATRDLPAAIRRVFKYHGALPHYEAALAGKGDLHARFELKGYMPLSIEIEDGQGRGYGWPYVMVCHFYMQNGDLMSDPLYEYVVAPDGSWLPVAWTLDGLGIYRQFITTPGRYHKRGMKDSASFSNQWAQNIIAQRWHEESTLHPDCGLYELLHPSQQAATLPAPTLTETPERSGSTSGMPDFF